MTELTVEPRRRMGRKNRSLPGINLRTSEWWEGVRDGVKYLGEKIPQKFSELPRKVSELEALQRRLSLSSLNSSEPQVNECGRLNEYDGMNGEKDEPKFRFSIILPKYESLETTVKNVRRDLGRLRSKSCDRLLKRRKSGRISPVQTATIRRGVLSDQLHPQKVSKITRSQKVLQWSLRWPCQG